MGHYLAWLVLTNRFQIKTDLTEHLSMFLHRFVLVGLGLAVSTWAYCSKYVDLIYRSKICPSK